MRNGSSRSEVITDAIQIANIADLVSVFSKYYYKIRERILRNPNSRDFFYFFFFTLMCILFEIIQLNNQKLYLLLFYFINSISER